MHLQDAESILFLHHVEIERLLRQHERFGNVSLPRKPLIQRMTEYWQQIRGRSAGEVAARPDCCAA